MQIGSTVILIEEHNFIGETYAKGEKFKVIGSDDMRGLDIQCIRTGDKIYETRMSSTKYIDITDWRNDRLNNLLENL